MNLLLELHAGELADRLGWTLLHSLWECAVVGLVCTVALQALRRRSAHVRYVAACAGLGAMLMACTATFWLLPIPARTAAEARIRSADGQFAVASMPDDPFREVPGDNAAFDDRAGARSDADRAERDSAFDKAHRAGGVQPEPAGYLRRLSAQAANVLAPWLPWCALAWLVGVLTLSVRNVGGWITVHRLGHVGVLTLGADIAQRMSKLAELMKLSRPVRLLRSALVEVPVTVGWLRPTILLPMSLVTGLTPSQLDAILAHELAHIRRYDYLLNLAQTVIETLLFYHPAVWWISHRIRIEREHCCDDWAVNVTGDSVAYARTLTQVGELRAAGAVVLPVGQAVMADGGSLLSRVRRLLRTQTPEDARPRPWLAGGAVLAMLGAGVVVACLTTGSDAKPAVAQPSAEPASASQAANPLHSRLVLDRASFRQGEPIVARVFVKNTSDKPVRYDPRDATHAAQSGYTLFSVTGPDGQPSPVIGASAQIEVEAKRYEFPTLKPGEEIRADEVRLDRQYYMRTVGKYRIAWRGTSVGPRDMAEVMNQLDNGTEPLDRATQEARKIASLLPPPPGTEIEVTLAPGGGPDGDLVGRILKVLPPGWRIDGAELLAEQVRPPGRTSGRGSQIGLVHHPLPGALMNNAAMDVFVMDQPAAADAASPDETAEYLGRGKLGHVYGTHGFGNPPSRWHHLSHDLATALEVTDPARPKPAGLDWGRVVSRILAACSQKSGSIPSLGEFCQRAVLTAGEDQRSLIHYESNLIRGDKTKFAARQAADHPYYGVGLSIRPSAPDGQLRMTPIDRSIQWDGNATVRGYAVGRLGVDIVITVLTDDAPFRKALNEILDREIGGVLAGDAELSAPSPAIPSAAPVSLENAGAANTPTFVEVNAVDTAQRIAVTARCEKREWAVGDEIPVTFVVTNQSEGTPYFIDWEPDRNGGWGIFRFDVFDEQGHAVPDPLDVEPVQGPAETFGRYVNLNAGKSWSKTIAVNRWALLLKPGTYKVVPVVSDLRPGPAMPGGRSDPRWKDRPDVLQRFLTATSVPLGPRPEAEWDRMPLRMMTPGMVQFNNLELPPITITIRPRSNAEMGVYVQDLARQLAAAARRGDRAALVRKLIFTGDGRATQILLQETYRPDASHYWVNEGFLYYLPKDRGVTQVLLDAAAKRGMALGMLWALDHRGCTEKDIKPLIEVSLAEDHPYSWADGAAAAKLYPDDRFVPRLMALAQRDIDARFPERRQAIDALALHRTDESVATLRQLLADRNEWTQAEAWGAVRSAWHFRHVTKGRPLREEDFDPKYRQPY